MAGFVEVNGKRYEIVPVERMTFKELTLAKALTGGMTPARLAQALLEYDAIAWQASIHIAAERAGDKLEPGALDDLELKPLLDRFDESVDQAEHAAGETTDEQGEADADPPEEAPAGLS